MLAQSGEGFADQILAGDAEVQAAGSKLARDLGGGEQHEVDAGHVAHAARVFTAGAAALERDAASGEPGDGVGLEAALGGDAELERHGAPPCSARSASGRRMPPTAGMARPPS